MRLLIAIAAGALLALGAPAAAAAQATCLTGCSSSAACNGTGRGSCAVLCEGGLCNCTDTKCDTQIRPSALADAAPAVHTVSLAGEARPVTPALLVDCRGNVLDVRLLDAGGRTVFADLRAIALRPARPRAQERLAARE